MSVLSDRDIAKEIGYGELDVSPIDMEEQLQPNSLDIRLGHQFSKIVKSQIPLDCREEITEQEKVDFCAKEAVIIKPGEFFLADTVESFDIPDYLYGQIHGRSSIGRLGIEIHSCAGLVDSGYSGNITLELCNNSSRPVKLYPEMRVAQVVFHELKNKCNNPYSDEENKYQEQEGVTHSRINQDFENESK
jgi:dCTP deaminase